MSKNLQTVDPETATEILEERVRSQSLEQARYQKSTNRAVASNALAKAAVGSPY